MAITSEAEVFSQYPKKKVLTSILNAFKVGEKDTIYLQLMVILFTMRGQPGEKAGNRYVQSHEASV